MTAAADLAMYPLKDHLPAPIYWPFRALRTLLVALCFAGFWSGAVAIGWLWLPIAGLWPGSRAERMHRLHRVVRRGFRLFHAVMHALRLYHRTSPAPSLRPAGSPVVLVANHPTLCDVTSIASLFPDVVAVARPSFAANPLLGRLVRGCGFVPTGAHLLGDCLERLRMGFDVLVFPEGTRSPRGGALHPFHRGAFELAARAGVPIVLLKLTCVPPALSKGLPIWKVSDHMAVLTVEPFDIIDPAATGLDSRALCRMIEQRYCDAFGYAVPAAPAVPTLPSAAADAPQPLGDLQ
jgi:1-acyl-sn-glycerol-3-phosphate acyltransferase